MEPDRRESPLLLAEFLSSLEEVGIRTTPRDYERLRLVFAAESRWTRSKLRAVLAALLAKSTEERDLFAARFDAFFDFDPHLPPDEESSGRIDVARALEELSSLRPVPPLPPLRSPRPELPRLRVGWRVPLAAALLAAAVLGLPTLYLERTAPEVDVRPLKRETKETPPPSDVLEPVSDVQRQYEGVPWIEDPEPLPSSARQPWSDLLTAALVLLGLGAAYGAHLWRSHRVREPSPFPFDADDPERFDPGRLGGAPAPWLADETLDLAAESLEYLETDVVSRMLDAEATVAATSTCAGLPVLVYRYRRELQRILILEDLHAAPRAWNPVAGELVEGLALRGAPVVHGRFAGSPEVFSGPDDEVVRLRDLEDDGPYLRVLLVSDGEGLESTARELLQEVAGWAAAVWLDPREPRSWPEAGRRPVRCGIPLFPATDEGVRQAFRHFASMRSRKEHRATLGRVPPPLPAPASLRAQVEEIAGDALPWAQACAMVQPLPVGLADALRCHFFPRLPPERLGRVFLLPGTRVSAAGLRFSAPVLAVLRAGFQALQDEPEQEEVLRFLLARIDAARPGKRDGLAALAWEALRERVCLELKPDEALEKLARLAATPLGPAIRADLRDVVLPGQGAVEDKGGRPRIPLRRPPESFAGRQHLARLAPSSGIPILRFRPLGRREWAVAGLLALSFLTTGGLGLARSLQPAETEPRLLVGSNVKGTWIRVGNLQGRWGQERSLPSGPFQEITEDLSGGFRVAAFQGGRLAVSADFPPLARGARLFVTGRSDTLKCTTVYPEFGLILERCPPDFLASPERPAFSGAGWREAVGAPPPQGRVLSVGLEIEGDPARERELRPLRNALLATGSVDLIYRIDLTHERALSGALREIRRQLDPWTDRAQLVWWWLTPAEGGAARQAAVARAMEDLRPAFATSLRLDRGANLAWASRIEELLTSEPMGRVTGVQVLQLLDGGAARQTPGRDVLLMRSPLVSTLPSPPPPLPVVQEPPVELYVLMFTPSSDYLTGISKFKLDEVALEMKQNPDLALRAVGYADPAEGERSGQRLNEQHLSEQRAEAVKEYVVSRHGIAPSQITTMGRGTAMPPSIDRQATSASDPYERQRVEIYLTLPSGTVEEGDLERSFTILAVNDVYRIEGVDGGRRGGLARLRTLRRQLEAQGQEVLLLHAGDMLYPSFLSRLFNGEQMIEVLNQMDGDPQSFDRNMYVTFGEHEFERRRQSDFALLAQRINESQFRWLRTNIEFAPKAPPSNIDSMTSFMVGDVRVGLISLTNDFAKPEYVTEFRDPLETARLAAARLRNYGSASAEVVIALTHLQARDDMRVLQVLGADGPDLIIGGHDHEAMAIEVDGRFVLKADADAVTATVVRVGVTKDGRVQVDDYRLVPLDESVEPDSEVAARVRQWTERFDELFCEQAGADTDCLDEVLGVTRTPLEGREEALRSRETSLGNWIADQMLDHFISANDAPNVAIFNAGTLRLNQDLSAGTEITRRHLEEMLPFSNQLCLLRIDGKTLRQVVSHAVSAWPGAGHWLQVAGIAFRFDPSRREAFDLTLLEEGKPRPIDDDQMILMWTNDYLVNPELGDQDGFAMLNRGQVVQVTSDLKAVLAHALRKARREGISPRVEGRICNTLEGGPCLAVSSP